MLIPGWFTASIFLFDMYLIRVHVPASNSRL